jgi:hypothetical protein
MGDAGGDDGLSVLIRKAPRGPVIAREPIAERDLADPIAELWFRAGLCRGYGEAGPAALEAQLRPVHLTSERAGRYVAGFSLTAEYGKGKGARCVFPREVLQPTAERASRRLQDEGVLERGDLYYYELDLAERMVGPLSHHPMAVIDPDVAPIEPLLERSTRVPRASGPDSETGGEAGDDDAESAYTVFYDPAAREKAEAISRKGGERVPAQETGGALVGRLLHCPSSGRLYSVIEDVLEATSAEESTFSLMYSGESWMRIEAVLRARRKQPGGEGIRIVGQCHSHPFLPAQLTTHDVAGSTASCDDCPLQTSCTLTTAFLSESDREWCRAVFALQPWQLSHVFGLTPRRQRVDAFYGQRGGSLRLRGYRLLDVPARTLHGA